MAGGNLGIAIWKIENLSCWSEALHGNFLESPEFFFVEGTFRITLYPRGTSGQEDHMVVRLSLRGEEKEFSGDLSFIDAEGSTLHTQRVQFKGDESALGLTFVGPKFKEVIVESRENVSDRKDQLTLRFQIKCDGCDKQQLCTVIDVFDVTMEVDPKVVMKGSEIISTIRYFRDEYDTDTILLFKTGEIREKIELYLISDRENTFLGKTHLRLISNDGSILRFENNELLFHGGESWLFSESLTRRELSENVTSIIMNLKIVLGGFSEILRDVYLNSDGVKIISNRVCEEKSLKTKHAITHNDQENASVCVLSKDLMCLYQDQDFSDLQLKCGSVSFPVHRNILSARSTVFKTMLSTDMTEAASGCVNIEDLDPSTLSRFLAFLYTGAVEDLQGESALKLYYAADKYDVPSLKKECVGFLKVNVSVSNVCDVLSLGNKHQDHELTAAADDFILRNYNEVLKSIGWSSFMYSEPLLAAKTLTDFAAKDFIVGTFNPL